MSNTISQLYAHFLAPTLVGITVTTPADAATVTSAEVPFAWTFGPGPQVTYRLRVYANADGTGLVYDSGIQISSTMSHTIPAGALLNGVTYYGQVDATNAQGQSAQSPLVEFTLSISPFGTITVSATPMGGACTADQTDLPRIVVSWSKYFNVGLENFIAYFVLRREAGEVEYTRIARLYSLSNGEGNVLSFVDAAVRPGATYQYAVLPVIDDSGNTLIGEPQDPPATARVDTDFTFVHLVGNGGSCEALPENDPSLLPNRLQGNAWRRFVRFDNWNPRQQIAPDVSVQSTWGNEKPAGFIGDQLAYTFTVPGLPAMLKDPTLWDKVEDLLRGQRDLPSVLCLRFGRAKQMFFVLATSGQRSHSQVQFTPELRFSEVRFAVEDWYCEYDPTN